METTRRTVVMGTDNSTFGELFRNEMQLGLMSTPSRESQLRQFRLAEAKGLKAASECQAMLAEVGCEPRDWNLEPEEITAEIDNLDHHQAQSYFQSQIDNLAERLEDNFIQDLEEGGVANKIGEIEWVGRNACTFNFYHQSRSRTLTSIITKTFDEAHQVIKARKHYLPARSVRKPKRCQELIKVLPEFLKRQSYIVTGTQINSAVKQVDQTTDPNEVVRAMQAVGRGIENTRQWIGQKSREREAENNNTIRFDPALIIGGQYVLFGWN